MTLQKIGLDELKKQFGAEAGLYDKYRRGVYEGSISLFFELLSAKSGKRILDLGCGTGNSTRPLVGEGNEVIGCDIDERMLAVGRKNAERGELPIKYVRSEAENTPFKDNSFYAVTIANAFHWFTNKDAMTEIKRVLKPDGLLFVYRRGIGREESGLREEIWQELGNVKDYRFSRKKHWLSECCKVLQQNNFMSVSSLCQKHAIRYTPYEFFNRMKTTSTYGSLREKQKFNFNTVARKVIKAYFREKSYIDFNSAIQICYGYNRKNK